MGYILKICVKVTFVFESIKVVLEICICYRFAEKTQQVETQGFASFRQGPVFFPFYLSNALFFLNLDI